ncbi:MAG: hypothetical protein IJ366_01790 [Clostridia bacterium]|nr:hypothetical protein [Clostridia bacterium]
MPDINDKNSLSELLGNAAEEVKTLGEKMNKELSDTISEIQREAKSGVNAITRDAIAAEKFYESETDRIQNAKRRADTRYLAGLRENVEKIKELRAEELKCLEISYEMGVISTEDYFSQLQDYRDRYFEQGSVEWLEFTAEILQHNKNLADEQEKALLKACETTAEGVRAQFEAIAKEQGKLEEKLSSFGGIAQHNTIVGDGADIEFMSLGKLGAQNDMLEEYLRLMTEAQTRINGFWNTDSGDSERDEKNMSLRNSYFAQLRDMSVTDATDFARVLTSISSEELSGYLGEYERRQELAENISKTLFSSEVTDTATIAGQNLGTDFAEALSGELSELSGKFFTSGESACKSFGQGFISSLSGVLAELSTEIARGIGELGLTGDSLGGSVENNTNYNIYGADTAEDTIRLIREREEIKKMLFG